MGDTVSLLAELRNVDKLPTLPEVLLEVLKLVNAENSDASILASIIEEDPALAARVLRVANSSFYGSAGRRLSSVALAVARLGFDEIRNITVAVSIVKHLSGRRSVLGYKTFWRHSLTAAFLSREIAKKGNLASDEAAMQRFFLAGLLHDIGILVLDQFFAPEFERISEHSRSHETSYLVSEAEILGKETHPMIGGALLEMWRLELPVIDAVRYHHAPARGPEKHQDICAAAALAEYILCNSSLGSFEGSFAGPDKTMWANARVSPDGAQGLFEFAQDQVKKSDLILTLGGEPRGLRSI
ncbi:MAG: HDOD domain-containing protein [Chitinivibrionales bacterium]|nr:HDOD domain-containing protein [Chitinivibrionales bacterium]MBD3394089.1 HDOD domain-containing protein [Chitinivibrionales bacterium]